MFCMGDNRNGSKDSRDSEIGLVDIRCTVGKVIFVLMIISGSIMTSSLAWDISDTFNGLMMIPNLIGVLSLSPLVIKITNNYVKCKCILQS